MKEGRSQSADESRAAAKPSENTEVPTTLKELSEESRKRKRLTRGEVFGPKEVAVGHKQLRLVDGSDNLEVISPPGHERAHPVAKENDPTDNLPLNVRFKGAIPTEGRKGFMMIRFQVVQG